MVSYAVIFNPMVLRYSRLYNQSNE